MQIPVLESSRLRLRGHKKEDFENCAAMWGDPRVTQFIGGQPSTTQQTWSRILTYTGHWAHLGFGYWLVEEKATGAFVGEIGFADFRRILDPPMTGIPEAGWALAPSAHGKGYATEALKLILEWGDRHFSNGRSFCIISPSNVQSIRVAEKCGYRSNGKVFYQGSEILVFTR